MLVSRPLCENRQTSVVDIPLSGRSSTRGFPASVQLLFTVEKIPTAAIFKSTSLPGTETPAVVGSTTTYFFPWLRAWNW
jgi:hypothetical protein